MSDSCLPPARPTWASRGTLLLAFALLLAGAIPLATAPALAGPGDRLSRPEVNGTALAHDSLATACLALAAAARQEQASPAQALAALEPLVVEAASLRGLTEAELADALQRLPAILADSDDKLPPPTDAALVPLRHAVGPFLLTRSEARILLGDRAGRSRTEVARHLAARWPPGTPEPSTAELIALIPDVARLAEGPWQPPADAAGIARVALILAAEGGGPR